MCSFPGPVHSGRHRQGPQDYLGPRNQKTMGATRATWKPAHPHYPWRRSLPLSHRRSVWDFPQQPAEVFLCVEDAALADEPFRRMPEEPQLGSLRESPAIFGTEDYPGESLTRHGGFKPAVDLPKHQPGNLRLARIGAKISHRGNANKIADALSGVVEFSLRPAAQFGGKPFGLRRIQSGRSQGRDKIIGAWQTVKTDLCDLRLRDISPRPCFGQNGFQPARLPGDGADYSP